MKQLIGFQPNREEYLWAEGVDISPIGISCLSDNEIEPNLNVFFMLSLDDSPAGSSVRGEGYVLRVEHFQGRYRFGIKIERIFEEDRPRFEAFLASLSE